MKKKQYNEKPSKYSNIGEDIHGAQRHNFNTYETTEEKAEKVRKKESKKAIVQLKEASISMLNETNFKQVILDYELTKAIQAICPNLGNIPYSSETVSNLKIKVIELKGQPSFESARKAYNKLIRSASRIKWNIRTLDDAKQYFEKKSKNQFTEQNGIKKLWKLESSFDSESIAYLKTKTKAVQFGNSLSESEREYCLENLAKSIKILEKYLTFDFMSIGFSYGARGKAGSVAHYQNSNDVLAFNRGIDGALIHELGHAIDYSLHSSQSVAQSIYTMPYSIQEKYRAKLRANKIENTKYYMKPTEIFARLFEQWIKTNIPELTEFMQFTFTESVMPDLDSESIEYMIQALKPILKTEES